ncbi:MAG: HlyD family secretion protein [Rhizobiales bacterium]|nr:HlyD family secretion protein [Hyphomicrobiales bacterium]OJY45538.1 MAG: transporter [Rhizobiales bacterium 64-17]
MADHNLKVVPAAEAKPTEAKAAPENKPADAATPKARAGFLQGRRRMLLVVGPLIVAVIGAVVYFTGGRYIGTDNAYIGAQKVLITPDISGKVVHVAVREGQHVKAGDELFSLDPEPFRLARDQAEAKLATAQTDYNNLKTNLTSLSSLAELAQKNVELKQHDVERKTRLLSSQATAQADVDTAAAALVTAQLQAQYTAQQRDNALNQLLGNRDLPLAKFPAYVQAKAALDEAQRNLDHAVLKAPIDGVATQVDNIQLGRFVAAGSPVLSVIDDANPWVDANPKETDITYLRPGQKVTIDVDTFPDHTFKGTVQSVSPGTGSQFSILPAQNASGNWVKVVQRVPVRIVFDKDENTHLLRSGMSVNVSIDTGHSRIPFMSTAQARTAEKEAR